MNDLVHYENATAVLRREIHRLKERNTRVETEIKKIFDEYDRLSFVDTSIYPLLDDIRRHVLNAIRRK